MDYPEYEKLTSAVDEFTRRPPKGPTFGEMLEDGSLEEAARRRKHDPEYQEMQRQEREREMELWFVSVRELTVSRLLQPHQQGETSISRLGHGFTPESLARCAIEGGLTKRKAENRIERFKAGADRMERLAELMEVRQRLERTIRCIQ